MFLGIIRTGQSSGGFFEGFMRIFQSCSSISEETRKLKKKNYIREKQRNITIKIVLNSTQKLLKIILIKIEADS